MTLGAVPELRDVLPPGTAEATADLLLASGAVWPPLVRWSRSPLMARVYRAFDWMLPGQFEAFAHRKAFCERNVRDCIAGGARQVLVLGAGYDTIGWRLAPELPGVQFFEIDHPATARLKRRGIERMGPRSNLHLIPADLGQRNLVDVMTDQEHWDAASQSVIIAEGLLMYLPPEAVPELFCRCASICGARSRIAFSYIPADGDGRLDVGRWTKLVLWIQRRVGEPWLWSIRPDDLPAFLHDTGWNVTPDLAASAEKHGVEIFAAAERQ